MKIWIIQKENSIGDLNSCLGVAQKLKVKPEVIYWGQIERAGGIPGFIETRESSNNYLDRLLGKSIFPDVVIACFKHSTHYVREIKRLSGGRTFLLNLRDPEQGREEFDLIINPTHAQPVEGDNVVEVPGICHRVSKDHLRQGRNIWGAEFNGFAGGRLKIAVMVGGNSLPMPNEAGGGLYVASEAEEFGKQICRLAKKERAALLVTNSHRTPRDSWRAFSREIKDVRTYIYDCMYESPFKNPYFGMLSMADVVVVTADSMSMCCEAAFTGKPVYIAGINAGNVRGDHKKLATWLIENGHARNLEEFDRGWLPAVPPLDTARLIAEELLRRMPDRNLTKVEPEIWVRRISTRLVDPPFGPKVENNIIDK